MYRRRRFQGRFGLGESPSYHPGDFYPAVRSVPVSGADAAGAHHRAIDLQPTAIRASMSPNYVHDRPLEQPGCAGTRANHPDRPTADHLVRDETANDEEEPAAG